MRTRSRPSPRWPTRRCQSGRGPQPIATCASTRSSRPRRATGADGIHPGYGFLAENADFAEAVGKAGIKFIGPSPSAMRQMGGKADAKAIAAKAGVPVVPGYQGDKQDARTLAAEAKRIGYPIMIKAVAGGGGRGMRLVEAEKDLAALLESAQREAQGAFGDGRVLIEKVVVKPRHIEVQVFGDSHGNVVHLFERDCSLQRRNQKVIEEAPAPGMSPELRAKICAAAVTCAKAVGYEGAGTVEFLVEGGALSAEAPWYFIEMNTRLQVEHPVTELITGLDLVEWQLRVASGERLPLAADQAVRPRHRGAAVRGEPGQGVHPVHGAHRRLRDAGAGRPAGRFGRGNGLGDHALLRFHDRQADRRGPDRATAIARLAQALEETIVAGPKTNASFLHALAVHPAFASADGHGSDCARAGDAGARGSDPKAIGFGVMHMLWHAHDDAELRSGAVRRGLALERAGCVPARRRAPSAGDRPGGQRSHQGRRAWSPNGPGAVVPGKHAAPPWQRPRSFASSAKAIPSTCCTTCARPSWPGRPSMRGRDGGWRRQQRSRADHRPRRQAVRQKGDTVAKGDRVAVVEAMKMEHVLHAARDGMVEKVAAKEGDQVVIGALDCDARGRIGPRLSELVHDSLARLAPTGRQPARLARHQQADDREVEDVGADAGRERRRVGAEKVVEIARQPAAKRHAEGRAHQNGRHAPIGFAGREQVADGQRVGGNEGAEAEAEGAGHKKQPGLGLCEQEAAALRPVRLS